MKRKQAQGLSLCRALAMAYPPAPPSSSTAAAAAGSLPVHGSGPSRASYSYSSQRTAIGDPSSPLQVAFAEYAKHLDALNEKRERIVKASRDITMNSKKVIFAVHRSSNKAGLDAAAKDLEAVKYSHLARVAQELAGQDYYHFLGSFCWGLQEYVEASTFLHFCQSGRLQPLESLNASLAGLLDSEGKPFFVTRQDYVLGLADLTGEVMRLAVSGSFAMPHTTPDTCREFVQKLYASFVLLPSARSDLGRDVAKKIEVMHSSLVKIERVAYALNVRGSEYPQEMLLNSMDGPAEEDRE